MTRETKIGLLVGLAFIIVIGILLSDHMTSTTEPQKAPLSVVGGNVRESIITPAAPNGSGAPAVAAVGGGQIVVTPSQPVLTGAEIAQPQPQPQPQPQRVVVQPAQPDVRVGPAQTQAPVVVHQGPVAQAPTQPQMQVPAQPTQAPVQVAQGTGQVTGPVGQPPIIDAPRTAPTSGRPPTPAQALQQLATRHGEEIIPVGTQQPPAARTQHVPMGAMREYKAQSGDSLSKLAVKFMGSNSKANRDAIIRVNPTLQQNPDKIVEGRTYVLPPAQTAVAEAMTTPVPPATPAGARTAQTETTSTRRAETPAPAPAGGENFTWYTVKENENLWKIAAEQLGSGNAWSQIRDLNQDILKGEDQVRANTRIRLPNKPVASAH